MNQHRRSDDLYTENIDELREKIEELSPELRLLARYIDAHAARHSSQTAELRQMFQTGKTALWVLKWLASLGFAISGMWAVISGRPHG
jgi:hypothetical protein